MKKLLWLALILVWMIDGASSVQAKDDFFDVRAINILTKDPGKKIGIREDVMVDAATNKKLKGATFVPCIEVQVETKAAYESKFTYAKLYVFDKDKKLVATLAPVKAYHPDSNVNYVLPVAFPKAEIASVYFELPKAVSDGNVTLVAVFGDQDAAAAKVYPIKDSNFGLDYPERKIVENSLTTLLNVKRPTPIDPVMQSTVMTGISKYPQIDLFLRAPTGITDWSQVKGVLALCLLHADPVQLRMELTTLKTAPEVKAMVAYAEKNQLAILAWGYSRKLWDAKQSYYELDREKFMMIDTDFDQVARMWAKGVKELVQKYHIPDKNYLLWGYSGAAQYAARLALRDPEFFLAVHVHVPSSFDKPTAKANQTLWLLTTGEKEVGYAASKVFYEDCVKLGYPIMFKAIPGLGHAGDPQAESLGLAFFDYALSLKREKEMTLNTGMIATMRTKTLVPWPQQFQHPAFMGDLINQDFLPVKYATYIPASSRVVLPTKELADLWETKP